MSLKLPTYGFEARAVRLASMALFCLFGLASSGKASATPAPDIRRSLSGLNSSFAIADFDGDRKPDLATVEILRNESSSNTQYSIRFELTAGITQVFGVTAPAGGLQIVARDVNGDDSLDLLVSTTWLHEQVAVLLNDGHGRFTLADPGAYSASFWGYESEWKSETLPQPDAAALVRPGTSAGQLDEKIRFDGLAKQAGCANPERFSGSTHLLFFSILGRAPPRCSSSLNTAFTGE
jgi:hypothetical protein